MARNKNSTALFDVIHAAKKPPKASPSASIPTPRWWGKDRKDKKVPQPLPNASTENVGRQQSWLTAAKKNGVVPLAATSTAPAAEISTESDLVIDDVQATTEISDESVAAVHPKPRFIDRFVNRVTPPVSAPAENDPIILISTPAVETESSPEDASAESPSGQWTDSELLQMKSTAKPKTTRESSRDSAFRVDSSAKEFSFRLSYGGLIAIGFIVLMALAIAFIAGQHSNRDTAEAVDTVPPKVAVKTGSQSSGMLAGVTPAKTNSAVADITSKPNGDVTPNILNVVRNRPNVLPEKTPATPTPTLPVKTTREIGLNYVIVQSYDEQEMAQKACEFINKNSDIKCTLVAGPADWAPHNWYSVIGLQPFAKRDPALPDYEKKIRSIGSRFSSNVNNQFNDPRLYTWRADSAETSGDETQTPNQ